MHMIMNHVIDVSDADHATGSNYAHSMSPGPEGQPRTVALGINEDAYVRTESGWKIQHRVTRPLIDISS